MLNREPIFIVAFAYGGSNILLNLLRTHPDVCSPRGELNEVFKGKAAESITTRLAKKLRYLPCVIGEGQDVFRPNDWVARKPFSKRTQNRVDRILFQEKLRARDASQNLYKSEGVEYSDQEIAEGRLLSKNLNGLIHVTDELMKMYPDATFLALVRNGFAVCEGHSRRGYDLERFCRNYELGCQKMIADANRHPNYHLLRYEEIIADPLESLRSIYRLAHLDVNKVKKVRLETKKVMRSDGSHGYVHGAKERQVMWYPLEEFDKHFRPDANENQIKRLSKEQQATIVNHCEKSLRHFGYLQTPRPVDIKNCIS